MKVARSDLVELFGALGVHSAPDWGNEKLSMKAARIDRFRDVSAELPKHLYDLFGEVEGAASTGETITVEGEMDNDNLNAEDRDAVESYEDKPAKAKVKKKIHPAKAKKDRIDKAMKVAKKVKAKPGKNGHAKPAKAKKGEVDRRGPGVQKAIERILTDTQKPLSKKAVLAKLVKMFPDRKEESMWNTVSSQLPFRLGRELKDDENYVKGSKAEGFWIGDRNLSGAAKAKKKVGKKKLAAVA